MNGSGITRYRFALFSAAYLLVWQSAGAVGPTRQTESAVAADVVRAYLEGLRQLDQEQMNRRLADEAVFVSMQGEASRVDREASRKMRDFERVVDTRWSFSIRDATPDRVTVEEFEANAFYDLLGVGARTQTSHYYVRSGLIYRMETVRRTHAHGDFADVYAQFKAWLMKSPAQADRRIVNGDSLVFDAQSAELMRPWLQQWAAQRRRD